MQKGMYDDTEVNRRKIKVSGVRFQVSVNRCRGKENSLRPSKFGLDLRPSSQ